MNYCSHCAHQVEFRVPDGDTLPRYVCPSCHTVHYQNPRVVVGCVPEYEGRILLCKRAIEPRLGYWTVPAGFLENGETLQAGAARETREEACADVAIESMLAVVNVTHVHQVHIMFRARMDSPQFAAGAESLDVELVRPTEIPWESLAFPSVTDTLQRYLEGGDALHITEITRRRSR
jgi:ADP-ribose pyrophosphatase YjhB (NUDIX family)